MLFFFAFCFGLLRIAACRHGEVMLRLCADKLVGRNLQKNAAFEGSVAGFEAWIESLVQSGRPERDMLRLARFFDWDVSDVSSREKFFTNLAIETLVIPNLNLLEFPDLFECPERQGWISRLVAYSARTGLPLRELRKFADRSGTMETESLSSAVIGLMESGQTAANSDQAEVPHQTESSVDTFSSLSQDALHECGEMNDLLRSVESSITDPEAYKFIVPDLTKFVKRFFLNLMTVHQQVERPRWIEVLRVLLDVATRILAEPNKYSRVALIEWIRSSQARLPFLTNLFQGAEEMDVAIVSLAQRIAIDFGIPILTQYTTLVPHWSVKKREAVSRLIAVEITFTSAGPAQDTHAMKLAQADEDRLLHANLIINRMMAKGIGIWPLKLAPLLDPIDWAMEFISKPHSRFANWVAQCFPPFPVDLLLPRNVIISEIHRAIDDFTGFPQKYSQLSEYASALHHETAWDRILLARTSWPLELPKKIMRLEAHTGNDRISQYAAVYLEFLRLIETAPAVSQYHIRILRKFPQVFNSFYASAMRDEPLEPLELQLEKTSQEMLSLIMPRK